MTRNDEIIRAVLRSKEHEEGRTLPEIAEITGQAESQIHRAAKRMPDLYKDRWETRVNSAGAQYHVAVYCVVVPPEDAPRPPRKERQLRTGKFSQLPVVPTELKTPTFLGHV